MPAENPLGAVMLKNPELSAVPVKAGGWGGIKGVRVDAAKFTANGINLMSPINWHILPVERAITIASAGVDGGVRPALLRVLFNEFNQLRR
jgi:hypothetical protein